MVLAEEEPEEEVSNPRLRDLLSAAWPRIDSCTYLGGTGSSLEVKDSYILAFTERELLIAPTEFHPPEARIPYTGNLSLEVSGPGAVREGGGFIGGGIGIEGSAVGIVVGEVLNALSRRTTINTVLKIDWDGGEMFFHSSDLATDELRMLLSPVFVSLRKQQEGRGESSPDPVTRLERLAALRDQGALTEEEYSHLKQKVIDGL